MSLNDALANVLSSILYAEKNVKSECILYPISKTIQIVLDKMNEKGFIGSYEIIKDSKGDKIKVNLIRKINNCGAIKPRYIVKAEEIEKFEQRFLPAKDFGMLLITTNQGIITNNEAKEKNIGGKLVMFIY